LEIRKGSAVRKRRGMAMEKKISPKEPEVKAAATDAEKTAKKAAARVSKKHMRKVRPRG
jgi:hypothetical protein